MAERKAEVAATVSVDCAGWDGGHEEGTSEVRKKEEEHLWRVLGEIATRGVLRYPWEKVRPLVTLLLEERIKGYEGRSDRELSGRLSGLLGSFREYPFTIQRICEILVVPEEYYSKLEQFAWALEKCLMVTETVRHSEGLGAQNLPSDVELRREVEALRSPPSEPTPEKKEAGEKEESEGGTRLQQGDASTSSQVGVREMGNFPSVFEDKTPLSMYNSNTGVTELQVERTERTEDILEMTESCYNATNIKPETLELGTSLPTQNASFLENMVMGESPQKKLKIANGAGEKEG